METWTATLRKEILRCRGNLDRILAAVDAIDPHNPSQEDLLKLIRLSGELQRSAPDLKPMLPLRN